VFGQSWLSFWENGALIGAGGVFIAIIAEFPEILEKFGRLPKWLSKERAKKIEAIAWAILLFGIGVETVAGQIARIIADEEIATLNGEASQAWLEVELLKTPRAITSMQSDILLHTLNPLLLKEQICVHADPSDGEAVQYAGQLAHALNNTGAQVVLDEGIVAMLIPSGKVSIVSGPDGLLDKQRQVVFDALKAAEIKVGRKRIGGYSNARYLLRWAVNLILMKELHLRKHSIGLLSQHPQARLRSGLRFLLSS
jgi:hypothetical protein